VSSAKLVEHEGQLITEQTYGCQGPRKAAGLWLYCNSPLTATVATEPIGYIGYYSERRILDLKGLVSSQVLDFYRSRGYSWAEVIDNFKPDYLVLRSSEYKNLFAAKTSATQDYQADLTSCYEVVKVFGLCQECEELIILQRVAQPACFAPGPVPSR
jgi:hypothetical protein